MKLRQAKKKMKEEKEEADKAPQGTTIFSICLIS